MVSDFVLVSLGQRDGYAVFGACSAFDSIVHSPHDDCRRCVRKNQKRETSAAFWAEIERRDRRYRGFIVWIRGVNSANLAFLFN